jgi:hypothetical protein
LEIWATLGFLGDFQKDKSVVRAVSAWPLVPMPPSPAAALDMRRQRQSEPLQKKALRLSRTPPEVRADGAGMLARASHGLASSALPARARRHRLIRAQAALQEA